MSSNKRKNKKSRFIGIPANVVMSEQFASLKAPETKLLVDLLTQYYGSNNGMLSPCHALMKKRGWASSSLYRAYSSLEYNGFIVVTRKGIKVRGCSSLVAITWNGIDEPKNGVDYDDGIKAHPAPLNYWCVDRSNWKHPPTLKPPSK